ncbi:hypothetical protein BSL78_29963, partial [Apostichopus japonicus]
DSLMVCELDSNLSNSTLEKPFCLFADTTPTPATTTQVITSSTPSTPVTTTDVSTLSTPSTPVTTTEGSTDSTPSTPVTTTEGRTSSKPFTPVATTEGSTSSTPSTPVTTTEGRTSSTPSTPVTTTEGRTSSTPSISTIPSTPPPGSILVSGLCAEYLDYRNANSETVFELVLSVSLDLVTRSIKDSNQCPDLLPAMCSLFYPPLPSSGYTLCQETCSQLFEECTSAFIFFDDAMPESCSNFPSRNEAGDLMCIGVSSTLPPGVLPVMGVCSDILPYKFAQSEPLFPLATSIPTARATELLASPIGQCSSLPAMCSLFYPPYRNPTRCSAETPARSCLETVCL